MSSENVGLVRALLPDSETDLVALFGDDAFFERTKDALASIFDPEFESTAVWQPGTTYRGRDGLRQLWRDWLEPWQSYYSDTEELIDAGDQVIVLSRAHGRPRDTDAKVTIVTGTVWEIRDGRVARIDFNRERAFALAGRSASLSG